MSGLLELPRDKWNQASIHIKVGASVYVTSLDVFAKSIEQACMEKVEARLSNERRKHNDSN